MANSKADATLAALEKHADEIRKELRVPKQNEVFRSAVEAGYLAALADGAGEGARLVAEHLACHKIVRDSCAIQLDKCAPVALTCIVNSMCDELFSCTGFSLDEDCRACGSNLLHLSENRFEGSAIADDPLERSLDLIRRSSIRHCSMISHRNPYV